MMDMNINQHVDTAAIEPKTMLFCVANWEEISKSGMWPDKLLDTYK